MWTSQTQQFGPGELELLETTPAPHLAAMLLGSDPIVALRALAEVQLNGDTVKLEALLRDPQLHAWWQQYASDRAVDVRDHGYATQLRTVRA
jgi:aryl carrier-like protein